MLALVHLVEYETNGQHAKFERYISELLFVLAGGKHIDTQRMEHFSAQLEAAYANPFITKAQKLTDAGEIKGHIRGKIRELRRKLRRRTDGSDDAGREADAG